jgi:hypothetical protein
MSLIVLNKTASPGTPATNKAYIFLDTADQKVKVIDQSGEITSLEGEGLTDQNFLINGGFAINQRRAAALTNLPGASTTARVYIGDRWSLTVGNATTPQWQRVDTNGALETGITARYYGLTKQLTNAAKHVVAQVVPHFETQALHGRIVRFQVKMKYTVSGSPPTMVRLGLLQNGAGATGDTVAATFVSAMNAVGVDPTWGTNVSQITPLTAYNGTIVGNAVDCSVTSAWQLFSATFLVPSDCKNLIPVLFTKNTLAANDTLAFTEAGLYIGNEIREWVEEPYSVQLQKCQRFYYKSFALDTVPADGANNGYFAGIIGKAGATALAAHIPVRYPTHMFKSVTPVLFSPGATGAAVPYRINGTTPAPQTAAAIVGATEMGCVVTATGDANGAVGDLVGVHATADADI